MRERAARLLQVRPANVVDLIVRLEVSVQRAHEVVADDLRAIEDEVARLTGRADDLAAETRLLRNLTQGAVLVGLAVLTLALRQAPVVVLRPVHEQDSAVAHDDAARRADHA